MISFTLSTFFIIAYNLEVMLKLLRLILTPPALLLLFELTAYCEPPVRFLVPGWTFSSTLDKELDARVAEYNKKIGTQGRPIQLVRRGEDFSALKELMALHLAGETPEIAAIEASEFPAISGLNLAIPLAKSKALQFKNLRTILVAAEQTKSSSPGDRISFPFEHTVPLIFINQERLFRIHSDPNQTPTTWPALVALIKKLGEKQEPLSGSHVLAVPLQGPRGLWIFEALAGKPLWERQVGGLKANRDLEPAIRAIQTLLDSPGLGAPDETWDHAVQSFLDRKSSVLIGSIDMIPIISTQATFRWIAGPLIQVNGPKSTLEGGSHLIVTRDIPEVWNFLDYLYSADSALRWTAAGGLMPLKKSWQAVPLWKNLTENMGNYSKLTKQIKIASYRTTDPEVVRTRSSWIQALHLLFGEPEQRVPTKTVFNQLDTHLTAR